MTIRYGKPADKKSQVESSALRKSLHVNKQNIKYVFMPNDFTLARIKFIFSRLV